jgi:Protein of unknown function, DUF547
MKCGWLAVALTAALVGATAPAGCAPAAPAPQYGDYRAALMAFVDARGLVDYAGLKEQRVYLDDFVTYLERLDPKTYDAWPDRDKIALWINAYNALTLRAIIDHYPIAPATPNGSYPKNSIRQIPGVWDFNRVHVMGMEITLQYIETKILRRDFHEPRIHMALVCAAVSCPTLRSEPYEGAKLESQLDDQVRKFLADPRQFHVDRAKKEVRVSEIFRWYAEDFAPKNAADTPRAGLVAFASKYVSMEDRSFLATNDYRITYTPYDWTLNEQPR